MPHLQSPVRLELQVLQDRKAKLDRSDLRDPKESRAFRVFKEIRAFKDQRGCREKRDRKEFRESKDRKE